jgi:hypothetical protein
LICFNLSLACSAHTGFWNAFIIQLKAWVRLILGLRSTKFENHPSGEVKFRHFSLDFFYKTTYFETVTNLWHNGWNKYCWYIYYGKAINIFKIMKINIKDRLKKIPLYIDKPNSFNENIGQTLGIIVLILFIGSLLYLLITGIPTIRIAFNIFLQTTAKLFNIHL